VLGLRPTETRTTSASKDSVLEESETEERERVTGPEGDSVAEVTLVESLNFIPCFFADSEKFFGNFRIGITGNVIEKFDNGYFGTKTTPDGTHF